MDNEVNVSTEAVSIVKHDFYVDDMCTSVSNVDNAKELIEQVSKLLRSSGFRLTKFLSNNKQVLESVPPEDRASSVVDLSNHELPMHKTLGVYWDASQDRFRVKVKMQKQPCSRRGLLSIINRTYDPLDIIQPYLLSASKLLQEACVKGLSWDEPMPSSGWDKWLSMLPSLESLSVE